MRESNRSAVSTLIATSAVLVPYFLFMAHEYDTFPFGQDETSPTVDMAARYGFSLTPEEDSQLNATITTEYREVADFWADRGWPLPEVSLATGSFQCDWYTGRLDPFYCIPNDTIYFSPESLYHTATQAGADPELLAEFVVSHEFAHALQDEQHRDITRLPSMSLELEADCLAATTMTEHSPGELAEIEQAIVNYFGDFDSGLNDHGTDEERVAAFRDGLDGTCPPMDQIVSVIEAATA